MSKRNNVYQLNLEEVRLKDGSQGTKSLHIEFDNHDDLFAVIAAVKSKKLFENEQMASEFSLGLKLFTEVILKNKENPLFADFRPAMMEFMKKLKNQ